MSSNDINRIRHTAWGQYIQSQLVLGKQVVLQDYTTLNEKFNINKTSKLSLSERPVVGYYAIGDGGHEMVRNADLPHIPDIIEHDAVDAAPYNMMPFVLRKTTNDLSSEQKDNYRLRRKETYNGVEYWAYYLKKIEVAETTKILLETTVDGVRTDTPYTPNENNLSPTKPTLTTTTEVTASNTKIRVSTDATIEFTEDDATEFMNVAKIIYGSSKYAVVSEIALVAGVDVSNYVSPYDSSSHVEIKGATVVSFISTFHSLVLGGNSGFTENINLGEKTPLMTNSTVLATVGVNV